MQQQHHSIHGSPSRLRVGADRRTQWRAVLVGIGALVMFGLGVAIIAGGPVGRTVGVAVSFLGLSSLWALHYARSRVGVSSARRVTEGRS